MRNRQRLIGARRNHDAVVTLAVDEDAGNAARHIGLARKIGNIDAVIEQACQQMPAEIISTPIKVLMTEPRPPIRLVPPITTAAITCRSMPAAALGSAASRRETWRPAATADNNPSSANTAALVGRMRIPARRIASSLV